LISTLEKEITFRFLKARKKDGFLNVISIFSFIGISLGVANITFILSITTTTAAVTMMMLAAMPFIAAILASVGGTLYGLDKSFKPFTYFNNMLPIFAAAIVGGIGNPFGAFLGGYVIAFSEILVTYAYRKFFIYLLPESIEPDSLLQLLSTDYKFAVSFSILVVVLLFRPSGIFKGKII